MAEEKGTLEAAYEKTKEVICDAAESAKEFAEDAYDKLTGKTAEQKAADKVKDAADWTADKIGDAREGCHDMKEKAEDKLDDARDSARDMKKKAEHKLDDARDSAHDAKEKAKAKGKDFVERTGEQVEHMGEKIKKSVD